MGSICGLCRVVEPVTDTVVDYDPEEWHFAGSPGGVDHKQLLKEMKEFESSQIHNSFGVRSRHTTQFGK